MWINDGNERMEKLKELRKKIDNLDKVIMDALDERLELAKEVGRIKALNNMQTLDKQREKEILKKSKVYKNNEAIKNIYQEIFTQSKKLQEFNYFLVGKTLNYSFSPLIYRYLGIENYQLLETLDFESIFKIPFQGINVTNPYKYQACAKCDILDETSKLTGVVNTIVRKDGKLVGYNTDYLGFKETLEHFQVAVNGKKVIIVGNGATAKTIKKVLESKNPNKIITLARNPKGIDEYLISDYVKFLDFEIIINATPYGTYPNLEKEYLFPLTHFSNLTTLIDVIYNPLKSPLLLSGNESLKKINGLYMLVSQATHAASIFLGDNKTLYTNFIYHDLLLKLTNIVLIGMPYAGKSTLGKKLSERLEKDFVDLDLEMKKNQHDLESILMAGKNESDFRFLEMEYANKFSKNLSQVIATGGGIVKSREAIDFLKRNGIIVYLDENLDVLKSRIDNTRPLIKSSSDLEKLYYERKDLYLKYSDIIIKEIDLERIVEKIYEYFSN